MLVAAKRSGLDASIASKFDIHGICAPGVDGLECDVEDVPEVDVSR
jgi:hypothetical protein